MKAEPQKDHHWLQQLVGEWTYEGEADCGPDQQRMKFSGTESVRSLGGIWIVGESQSKAPDGSPATMIITLGFDPLKQRYTGTWIGSMMMHMWIYDGELDASGRVLTLSSEGPSMTGDGSMAMYQDIIEIVSPDHRILRSRAPGADGKLVEFMESHYRRKA